MSPRARLLAVRSIWIVGMLLVVGALVLTFTLGRAGREVVIGEAVFALAVAVSQLTFLTIGAVIVSRQPANRIGLLFLADGFLLALGLAALNWSEIALLHSPGSLPAGGAAAWIDRLVLPLAISLFIPIFLLFPDGKPPSPRWRPVLWLWVVAMTITLVGWMTGLAELPVGSVEEDGLFITVANPTFIASWLDRAAFVGGFLLGVSTIATGVAIVVRFRRSKGDERQQLRWLTSVGVAFLAAFALQFVLMIVTGDEDLPGWIGTAIFMLYASILLIGLPVAIGIAILKYRLYDLDLVIRKTVVVGALAAFVTLVYVAIVVGLGSLIGASLGLRILATAVVALAFQPARERATHLANRLVYGRRATPYETLARFSDRVGGTYASEDVLPRVAHVIAEGTASRADVWLAIAGSFRLAASWPVREEDGSGEVGDLTAIEGDHVALVVQRGEVLGAIAVSKDRADPLTPNDAELVDRLAEQAGLVVANARLTADLEARLEDIGRQAAALRASRQRIVAAQDEERRRLERNIHDGAQQHLVALAVKLRLARAVLERDPEKGRLMLGELCHQVDAAIETIRSLSLGVYPPLLEEQGIAAALEAQYTASGLPVQMHSDGLGRYPIEIEAAVYFCVLEALQNAAKYAEAATITVTLAEGGGTVEFQVTDDGGGFDPQGDGAGTGLAGMRDRLAVFGGSIDVESTPGHGTSVRGTVPAGSEVAV